MGIFSEKLHSHSPSWTYQLLGIPHDYGNPHSLIPPLPASQLRKAVTAPMGSAFTRCQMAEQVPPFKEPPFSVIAKNLNDMHVIICIYIYVYMFLHPSVGTWCTHQKHQKLTRSSVVSSHDSPMISQFFGIHRIDWSTSVGLHLSQ